MQRLRAQLQHTADLVRRVIHQNAERFEGRHLPEKVFSLHEPHVVSIRKGKRAKGTEYGSKVSLSIDRHGFVITHTEYACISPTPTRCPLPSGAGTTCLAGHRPNWRATAACIIRGMHGPGWARPQSRV